MRYYAVWIVYILSTVVPCHSAAAVNGSINHPIEPSVSHVPRCHDETSTSTPLIETVEFPQPSASSRETLGPDTGSPSSSTSSSFQPALPITSDIAGPPAIAPEPPGSSIRASTSSPFQPAISFANNTAGPTAIIPEHLGSSTGDSTFSSIGSATAIASDTVEPTAITTGNLDSSSRASVSASISRVIPITSDSVRPTAIAPGPPDSSSRVKAYSFIPTVIATAANDTERLESSQDLTNSETKNINTTLSPVINSLHSPQVTTSVSSISTNIPGPIPITLPSITTLPLSPQLTTSVSSISTNIPGPIPIALPSVDHHSDRKASDGDGAIRTPTPSVTSSPLSPQVTASISSIPTDTLRPIPITLPPVVSSLPSPQVTARVSSISTEILGLIRIIESWEKDPQPPSQSEAEKRVNEVKVNVEKLISDLGGGGSSSECSPSKKRSLVGNILDIAGGAINGLTCVANNINRIAQGIDGGNVHAVKGLVNELMVQSNNPPPDGKDPTSTPNSESRTTSTKESTSCTSVSTAHHVEILCQLTPFTSDGSTTSTTTCSPTTTITTTGCSITDATTTVTSTATPTPSQLCTFETCGDACSGGGAKSLVAILESIDCSLIPSTTVSSFPTADSGVVSAAKLKLRHHEGSPSSRAKKIQYLPEFSTAFLPPKNAPVDWPTYVTQLSHQVSDGHGWLGFDEPTTGRWFPFGPGPRQAFGVKGLRGCTSVMIVTQFGVYVSHIFESPIFVHINGVPTPDEFFQWMSFGTLFYGGEGVSSIQSLMGTDDAPGVLHPIYEPRVFIVTPWVGSNPLEFSYVERARWLGNQLNALFNPSGSAGKEAEFWGYVRTDFEDSMDDNKKEGRAIMEVATMEGWELISDTVTLPQFQPRRRAFGRWRLWVGGLHVTDYRFFYYPDPQPMALHTRSKRAPKSEVMCISQWEKSSEPTRNSTTPVKPSGTQLPSTFITSTRATSGPSNSTESTTILSKEAPTTTSVVLKSPPGPPPGSTSSPTAQPSTAPPNPPAPPPSSTAQPSTVPPGPPKPLPSSSEKVTDQKCWRKDLFKHGPVDSIPVQEVSKMCIHDTLSDDQITVGPGEKLFWDAGIPHKTVYYAEIRWREGCEGPPQNAQFPMEGFSCQSLLLDSWKNCKSMNDGAGGYRTVGCLTYMFVPQLPSEWSPNWTDLSAVTI